MSLSAPIRLIHNIKQQAAKTLAIAYFRFYHVAVGTDAFDCYRHFRHRSPLRWVVSMAAPSTVASETTDPTACFFARLPIELVVQIAGELPDFRSLQSLISTNRSMRGYFLANEVTIIDAITRKSPYSALETQRLISTDIAMGLISSTEIDGFKYADGVNPNTPNLLHLYSATGESRVRNAERRNFCSFVTTAANIERLTGDILTELRSRWNSLPHQLVDPLTGVPLPDGKPFSWLEVHRVRRSLWKLKILHDMQPLLVNREWRANLPKNSLRAISKARAKLQKEVQEQEEVMACVSCLTQRLEGPGNVLAPISPGRERSPRYTLATSSPNWQLSDILTRLPRARQHDRDANLDGHIATIDPEADEKKRMKRAAARVFQARAVVYFGVAIAFIYMLPVLTLCGLSVLEWLGFAVGPAVLCYRIFQPSALDFHGMLGFVRASLSSLLFNPYFYGQPPAPLRFEESAHQPNTWIHFRRSEVRTRPAFEDTLEFSPELMCDDTYEYLTCLNFPPQSWDPAVVQGRDQGYKWTKADIRVVTCHTLGMGIWDEERLERMELLLQDSHVFSESPVALARGEVWMCFLRYARACLLGQDPAYLVV
jgi:hypothetical protein